MADKNTGPFGKGEGPTEVIFSAKFSGRCGGKCEGEIEVGEKIQCLVGGGYAHWDCATLDTEDKKRYPFSGTTLDDMGY